MAAAGRIEALHDPSIYPEPTQHIERHETHASLVFVTDHDVYNVKKNVFSRHYEPIDASEQASCLPIDMSQPLRSSCMQALGDIYQWRRNV